jgi:predicted nucleic-acid-binding protein
MIGLDTNLWVRYVTNDDPRQAALAVELIARCETIYVSKTVLLELEWVLRGVYELARDTVVRALLQILGLSNVVAEAPEQVALALEYHQQGLDFADALHLTSANYDVFHTFDAGFAKRGKRLGLPVKPVDSPSTSGSI